MTSLFQLRENCSQFCSTSGAAWGMAPAQTTRTSGKRRWRILVPLIGGVALVAIGYTLYWAQVLRYHQGTDDAYVGGNVVQITPQISGTVIGIGADDTQFVKAGQPLVRLDQADARVALDQAEAQLARTVRDVRNLFATTSQLDAAVQVRQSDLDAAQKDLVRRQQLGSSGAVSGEELQHARDAVKGAQAGLLAAQQQLAATRARVDNTTLEDHPQVRDAAAAVRNAYLQLSRTELPAPVAGFVARDQYRSAQHRLRRTHHARLHREQHQYRRHPNHQRRRSRCLHCPPRQLQCGELRHRG